MRINYILIPLGAIGVAWAGSYLTNIGLPWYFSSNLPGIAPTGAFIGLMWTIIYLFATISFLLWFNQKQRPKNFWMVNWLFIINGLLNVGWSYLFFFKQWTGSAIIEMLFLEATVIWLIVMMWRKARWSSILLWLYAAWVAFATYLAYIFWLLNK
ncbi:tryptophan-rich sensory protein [Patescibacteria group bacterium]|nr:tryptophan-rich sensory protein [Patescibacteria group bacterium]